MTLLEEIKAMKPHRKQKDTDCELAVMSYKGDTKIIWDRNNPDEVKAAKDLFKKLKDSGFVAFKVEGREGDKGEQIREFDPDAQRLIMAPPIRGG